MRRLAAAALGLALAACTAPSPVGQEPAPSPSPTGRPYAADELVLQVRHEGGFVPPAVIADIPLWSLYGDGRVIASGPDPTSYPGRALPRLRMAVVSQETVRRIVREAFEAGVDGVERDYGNVQVSDAPTTVFELDDGTRRLEARVYALGVPGTDGNEARTKLRDLLRRLTDAGPGGYGAGTDDEVYEPAAVAVYAKPYVTPELDARPQVVAWTGPDPAAGERTLPGRCTVLTGAALAEALPAFRKAHRLTRWKAGDDLWSFALRPLLPDEDDCAAGLREGHSQ